MAGIQRWAWALIGVVIVLALIWASRTDPAPAFTQQDHDDCAEFAYEGLDTRLHDIGGNRWDELVDACLRAKAED